MHPVETNAHRRVKYAGHIEAQLRVMRQQLRLAILQSYWMKPDSIFYSSHSDWINVFCLDPSSPYIKQIHIAIKLVPIYRKNSYASRSHKASRGNNGRSCHANQYAGGSHIISIAGRSRGKGEYTPILK